MPNFTEADKIQINDVLTGNKVDLDQELYEKLYDHFIRNGEMPYGVAKARTGDPVEWVHEHAHEVL